MDVFIKLLTGAAAISALFCFGLIIEWLWDWASNVWEN